MTAGRWHVWLGIGAALAAACGGGPSREATSGARVVPEYSHETGRLERLRHDANNNGVAETVTIMDGSRMVRIEVDLNEDGQVDRWEHYGSQRQLEKVGFSRDNDGRETAWSYADTKGAVVRVEVASQSSDRIARTEHFENGVLVLAQEDTNADGTIDQWEAYEAGRLARLTFSPPGAPARTLVYDADGGVRVEDGSVPESATAR